MGRRDMPSTLFLSTPSGWRATIPLSSSPRACPNFYPRPPGGGRLDTYAEASTGNPISIHALRVEGDCLGWEDAARTLEFLSTPSGWRATAQLPDEYLPIFVFLSTPSGWRATSGQQIVQIGSGISIHALRVEGDHRQLDRQPCCKPFLSTPSGWRATRRARGV